VVILVIKGRGHLREQLQADLPNLLLYMFSEV